MLYPFSESEEACKKHLKMISYKFYLDSVTGLEHMEHIGMAFKDK
jgi:hypothetical protein